MSKPVFLIVPVVIVVLVAWMALVYARGWQGTPGSLIGNAVIILAGLAAIAVAKRRGEVRDRSRESGSIERVRADSVQALAYRDLLIALVVALAAAVVFPQVPAVALILGLLIVAIADFWVRYLWVARHDRVSAADA